MNDDFVDGVMGDLSRKTERAMDELVTEVRADLIQALSIPVEKRGGRIIRSKPGENPRRETGAYIQSIDAGASREGDSIVGSVSTDSEIGGFLENGTGRMQPRPHFTPALERWEGEAAGRLAEGMGEE